MKLLNTLTPEKQQKILKIFNENKEILNSFGINSPEQLVQAFQKKVE